MKKLLNNRIMSFGYRSYLFYIQSYFFHAQFGLEISETIQ
jgi:hypothetical protein